MSLSATSWFQSLPKWETITAPVTGKTTRRRRLRTTELLVLGYLADHWNNRLHYAFPSIRRMGNELGMDRRQFSRVLTRLGRLDLVPIQRCYHPLGSGLSMA